MNQRDEWIDLTILRYTYDYRYLFISEMTNWKEHVQKTVDYEERKAEKAYLHVSTRIY